MKLLNILTSNVVEQGTKFGSMIDPETGVAIGQTIGSLDFSDPTKVVARKPQDVHLSEVGKKIISAAESQIGQPYVWGAEEESEGGFDCSGLVTWAYNQAGVSIPRGTAQTFFDSSEKVEKENVKVGDLIFFDASTERAGVDHIGIVHNVDNNGNIDMIHASTGSGVVIEKNILNGYYGRVLKGFGRMPQTKS
jgi:cell wall-associated NlpC family hydrolase